VSCLSPESRCQKQTLLFNLFARFFINNFISEKKKKKIEVKVKDKKFRKKKKNKFLSKKKSYSIINIQTSKHPNKQTNKQTQKKLTLP